ncbi:MAG: diguanylate cyclase [Erysipelotrichaceae bacterium]|nr:diguanylate cyclase [Erysipelotrichaceae bacterium]
MKNTILVIEDNSTNMEILDEILKDDYNILSAKSGEEGMDIFKDKGSEIDLVLSDIVLGGIDGFEVLRQIKESEYNDIPVIMISSEDPESMEKDAYTLGASDYVRRPYDMAFMKRRIDTQISLYAMQKKQLDSINEAADYMKNSLDGKRNDSEAIVESLISLKNIYDIVRLVDVSNMIEYQVSEDGHVSKGAHHCFEVWGKTGRCENCISARAYHDKGRHSKYEFIGDNIFLATTKYIEIEGMPFVIEMVSAADDTIFLDAMGKQSLIKKVLAQNSKLYVDALTGAYNRNYLNEQLIDLKVSAIAIIDVDNFKNVNDGFGHLAGDEALKKVAETIKSKIRNVDALIRYGGDEFIAVFSGIQEAVLPGRLELIRSAVEDLRFEDYPDLKVTLSIGGQMTDNCHFESIEKADKKLYEAKKTKNTVIV